MKKLFFLCLALISVTQLFAYAYDCYVDGIYYNLDYYNKVATVTNERNYMSAYSYSGSVVIPSTFSYQEETYTVKFIGTYAFEACSELTSVTIPNSVIYIGHAAFLSCSKLSSINIPNSVTEIDSYAFSYCSGLTSITIPNSVTTIREYAFQLVNNVVYEGTATGAPWMAKCVNGYVEGSFVYQDNTKSVLCGCSSVTEGDIIIPNSVKTIGNNAFYHCNRLTSVEIGNSVTTIENDAFYWCDMLKSITLGNSVTTIGESAFSRCSDLTSIIIPNSVTTIGGSAFYYCPSLTSVTIGNSVTTIGGGAFRDCSSLPSITIPYSVTSIGEAFYGCDSLKSVTINSDAVVSKSYNVSYDNNGLNLIFGGQVEEYTIGDSVTAIGDYAFSQCEQLTAITIGKSVTKIGNSAFLWCSGLTSVTIPNSVTTIEDDAFYGCSGLTSITIPDFVETIGEDAFYDCSSATSLTIGYSVKSIAEDAFEACEELKNIIWKAKNCNASWIFNKEIIESFIFGDSVEVIPAKLCYGMNKITTISIPNSVTTIGNNAFYGCTSLTSVTIPYSVTTIGEWAFVGCDGLTSVTINSNAFISKSYSPEHNINSIFDQDVKKYILGDSIKSIGDYAFYCSSGFTSINIPHSVVTIGNSTFSRSSLKSINIPNSVTNIGNAAFSECFNLESVSLGNSVTTIGDSAFHFCHISSITIPRSIKTIGKDAFLWCNLTETNYTGTLSDWCGIKFGNKEANPIYYSHNFFINNEEVENDLIIPENVSSIEAYAFEGCFTLTSVTIPNSIKFIGERAFEECSNLTNVFVNWTDASFLPIIGKDIFASISDYSGPSNATLHVPAGTKSIYETADQWKDFGFIIEEGTGLEHIKPNSPASLLRCTKTIENGQLLIKAKGETYTPSGQKVR